MKVAKKNDKNCRSVKSKTDCGNFDKLCFIWPFQNKHSSQLTAIINLK